MTLTLDTFWLLFSVLFVAVSCFPFAGTGRTYAMNLAERSHLRITRNTLFLAFLFGTLARSGLTVVLFLVLFEPFRQVALAVSLAGMAMIALSTNKEVPGARHLPTGIRIFLADVILNLDNVILVAILSRKELALSFQVFIWMLSTSTLVMIWWLMRKEFGTNNIAPTTTTKKKHLTLSLSSIDPLTKYLRLMANKVQRLLTAASVKIRSITNCSILELCWLGALGWFIGYISVTDTAIAPWFNAMMGPSDKEPLIPYPVLVGIFTEGVTYCVFTGVICYRLFFTRKSIKRENPRAAK